jgi:hypothetical protein
VLRTSRGTQGGALRGTQGQGSGQHLHRGQVGGVARSASASWESAAVCR